MDEGFGWMSIPAWGVGGLVDFRPNRGIDRNSILEGKQH